MRRAQNCVINGRTGVRSADVQTRMYFRFTATIVSYRLRVRLARANLEEHGAPRFPVRTTEDPWRNVWLTVTLWHSFVTILSLQFLIITILNSSDLETIGRVRQELSSQGAQVGAIIGSSLEHFNLKYSRS